LEAYCVKCKTKREMKDPQAVFTSTGTPATSGVCPVCGTKLYRMGRTDAHQGLTPPEVKVKKGSKKNKKRSGKLVIVESPAKARTVKRFLGKGYKVEASVGHVRDLLRSQLSVDVGNDFKPKYRVPNEKRPVVKEIKGLAKNAEEIYLATDPDREGEAIAWHLMESAEMDPEITRRVVFHEITRPAIEDSFSHPREINMCLVDAQQARRILDRLVGYNLSPLLWRKVRGRLSAGRVQSVALRLVVEREREIETFIPEEYWTIAAELQPDGNKDTFIAKLFKVDGDEPSLSSEDTARPIAADMEGASYVISEVRRGQRKRKPAAPFTTSSLQQEASRKLRLSARRTMSVAQQLYEGIDIGDGGNVGLITYMRTDSTNVSELAQNEARQYIVERFGGDYLPKRPPKYKTKARGAQEAHEAIRPTSVNREPGELKNILTRDQFRMYQLIWRRFVASQMSSAIYDTMTVEVTATSALHTYLLKASSSAVRFKGFLEVYEETKPKDQAAKDNGDTPIPADVYKGQTQKLIQLITEQHFTQPPSRYSEASLVRVLEENGIGRPSTYAPILSTLQQRGYVVRDKRRLFPTETGFLVNDIITEHFPEIVNVEFTAQMERDLDRVASGEQPWVEIVREFYEPFSEQVARADEVIPEMKTEPESIGRDCPNCGHDLVVRWGRYGKFISCSNFPECRYTEPLLEKIGVDCPQDGGELVERRSRKGRVFYGCANYPKCDFTSWKRPLSQPCPNCGGLLVQANKNHAQCTKCEERYHLDQINAKSTIETA
jgi:DNA topoisomerase-1